MMIQPQIAVNLSAAQICGGTATRTDLNAAAKNMPNAFQGIMRDGMNINRQDAHNSARGIVSEAPEKTAIFALNDHAAGRLRENVMETLRDKAEAALPGINATGAGEGEDTQLLFDPLAIQDAQQEADAKTAQDRLDKLLKDKILRLSAEIVSILEGIKDYAVDKASAADIVDFAGISNIIGTADGTITAPAQAQVIGGANASAEAEAAMQADMAKAALINSSANTVSKELAPLIAQLSEAIEQLGLPEDFRLQRLLENATARMPIEQMISDNPEEIQNFIKHLGNIRMHLCPPENGNDKVAVPAEAELNSLTEQGIGAEEKVDAKRAVQNAAADSSQINASFADTVAARKVLFSERPVAPAEPVTQDNLLKTMVDKISSITGDKEHMEIKLMPDKLGKVTVELVMSEKGLSAKIIADNQEVRNLLAANTDRLSETLTEKGLKVANIDIIFTDLSGHGFKRPNSGKQNNGRQDNDKAQPLALDSISALFQHDFTPDIEDTFVPGFSESSVEYRA